jgi:hypothetical protein
MITFTTESVLQKFMLRFEELKLDCNDHLYIYDGDIAVGNPKVPFLLLRSNIRKFAGHHENDVILLC